MGTLDAAARQAAKVMDQFAKSVTLRRSSYTKDPDQGQATISTTDYTEKALIEQYPERLVNGETIQRGDLQVWVRDAALSIEPDPTKDVLIIGSTRFEIVGSERLYSGSDVVLWKLQARR